MKKKLVSVLLCSAMVASMLAGCGSNGGSDNGTKTSGTEAGTTAAAGDGSVYLLNFKPETDAAWQELAATYKEQTGVDVTVVTAADGEYKTHFSQRWLSQRLQQSSQLEASLMHRSGLIIHTIYQTVHYIHT